MEVSYCTFGFGVIIRRNLPTLSLPRDSPGNNLYACGDLSPCRKGNSCSMKLLGGLNYEKIQRYNNSPPYVMARWLPQQIPPLNFCGTTKKCTVWCACIDELGHHIHFQSGVKFILLLFLFLFSSFSFIFLPSILSIIV